MSLHNTTEELLDLADGNLSPEREAEIRLHLKQCEECSSIWEELQQLDSLIATDDVAVPSEKLTADFNLMLKQEMENLQGVQPKKRRRVVRLYPVFRVAAVIALLVGSFYLGAYYQQKQNSGSLVALKEDNNEWRNTATLSLLESASASKRIQGINNTADFSAADTEIAEALIYRMLYDDNDNVRLVAAEALPKFSGIPKTREALLKALEEEKNPIIKIKVIKILVQIKEKKAIAPLKRIQEDKETMPLIKKQIEDLLPHLI